MTRPIVLGAGPAGSAAALLLAKGGAKPLLIDRDAEVGDALCGGFLSWRTVQALHALGCDPERLGGHRVTRLRLFAGDREAHAALPAPACGLSRRALDSELRRLAVQGGARLVIDRARRVAPGRIEGDGRTWDSPAIFLATGKHDVRGAARPREGDDLALGLRVRLPGSPRLERLFGDAIELHLFPGGYAGIVLQEGGSANICLALRKSALAEAGGDPRTVLTRLVHDHPHFARRMEDAPTDLPIDTIGAVPYGWIARQTVDGVFRLGDQAAVIPSLAGEGMGIALASARAAVESYLRREGAAAYQRDFAQCSARPVRLANALWHMAETQRGGAMLAISTKFIPGIAGLAMRLSRIL